MDKPSKTPKIDFSAHEMDAFRTFNQPYRPPPIVFKSPRNFDDFDSDYDSEEEAEKKERADFEEGVAAEELRHKKDIGKAREGINSILNTHNIQGNILTTNPPPSTYLGNKGRNTFTANPFNNFGKTKSTRKLAVKDTLGRTGDAMANFEETVAAEKLRQKKDTEKASEGIKSILKTHNINGGRRRKRPTRRSRKTKSKRRKTRRRR